MTDANISRIALSLWTSKKWVERLPRLMEFTPRQEVNLVYTSNAFRAGDYL